MGKRKTLTWRIKHRTFPELPWHYMQPKRKEPPITVQEAGRKRWADVSHEERSELMRQLVLKRWAKHRKKTRKKPPKST